MLEWLTENTDLLSLAVNAGMLVIWLAYLQVFLRGYRRQVRPKIVINRGGGDGVNARCFVSNMSQDAIYVEDIHISIRFSEKQWETSVIDVVHVDANSAKTDPKRLTHQGPLKPGEYMEVGRYRDLLDRVLATNSLGELDTLGKPDDLYEVKVEVIADYAGDDLLIAARRRFFLRSNEQKWLFWPATVGTEQVRSRSERQQLEEQMSRWLERG